MFSGILHYLNPKLNTCQEQLKIENQWSTLFNSGSQRRNLKETKEDGKKKKTIYLLIVKQLK